MEGKAAGLATYFPIPLPLLIHPDAICRESSYPFVARELEGMFDSWIDSYNEPPLCSPVGVAEYTNVNFVSKDTLVSQYRTPYLYEPFLQPSSGYYWSYTTDLGENVSHYVTNSYLSNYLPGSGATPTPAGLMLDDNCYDDHAKVLLPKAASYAAGLLQYFFDYELRPVAKDGVREVALEYYRSRDRGDGCGDTPIPPDELPYPIDRMFVVGNGRNGYDWANSLTTWGVRRLLA